MGLPADQWQLVQPHRRYDSRMETGDVLESAHWVDSGVAGRHSASHWEQQTRRQRHNGLRTLPCIRSAFPDEYLDPVPDGRGPASPSEHHAPEPLLLYRVRANLNAGPRTGPAVVANGRAARNSRPEGWSQNRLGCHAGDASDDQQAPAHSRQLRRTVAVHEYQRSLYSSGFLSLMGLAGRVVLGGLEVRHFVVGVVALTGAALLFQNPRPADARAASDGDA